jgi:hypothetical protein
VSELLERIQSEIRERLEASRAAVREHERLEAALHALSEAGSRATRAVTERGRSTRAPSRSARPSSSSRKRASAAARSSKQAAAPSKAKRTATAGAEGSVTARTRRRSGATAGGRGQPTRRGATGPAASAGIKKTGAARATGAATPARKRAARGANREAVLRVIGERPGVSARALAAASEVTGGTLYTLLRRLTQEGTLEKRELPGGQTGYAIAASAASGAEGAATERAATTIEPGIDAEPGPASEAQQGGAVEG